MEVLFTSYAQSHSKDTISSVSVSKQKAHQFCQEFHPGIPFVISEGGLKRFKKDTQHKRARPILMISCRQNNLKFNGKEIIARKAKLMTKMQLSSLVTLAFQNTVLIFWTKGI